MDATERGGEATQATTEPGKLRLNVDLFDRLAAKHGARTQQDRANLVRVDRATFIRWRQGYTAPSLDVAMRIADQLGTRIDKLWQREPVEVA
jgi:DNA-binding XRE family transcriptional regulator